MLFYIDKLEQLEFPYLPTKYFNPRHFYILYKDDLWNHGLAMACYTKNRDLINYMLEKGAKEYDLPILNASSVGDHETVFKLLKKRSKGDEKKLMNKIMEIASANGHKDLLNFSIQNGSTNFQEAVEWAARNGEIEIIKMLINENIVFDFDKIKFYAKVYNNIEVTEFLKNI